MTKLLSKSDFCDVLAEKLEFFNQSQVKQTVELFLGNIIFNVANGSRVILANFASSERKCRNVNIRKNPKIGVTFKSNTKNYPKFSADKNFKEIVNN